MCLLVKSRIVLLYKNFTYIFIVAWVLSFGNFSFRKKQQNLIIEAEQGFIEFRDAFVFNQAFIDKLIQQAQQQDKY